MSTKKRKPQTNSPQLQTSPFLSPAPLCGILLTAVAAVRCFALGGGPFARWVPVLCLLGMGVLCLWLLSKEGYKESELAKMLLPIGLALFVRAFFLPHSTLDYQNFLSRWVEHFRQNGGFVALKDPVGNYNVPYLYILSIISYLPLNDLYLIKFTSILFDVLLAWGGLKLVKCLSDDQNTPLWAFSALLLLPTVVLNGACWAQCDSIWAALCVLALVCALTDKSWQAMVLLALAFAFKLQAIFLVPLGLPLLLAGRVKWKHLPIFPLAFLLTMLPAMLMGKPFADILSIYLNQAGDSINSQTVNYNSPSVFTFFPHGHQFSAMAPKAAIVLSFLFALSILALLIWKRQQLANIHFVLAGAALTAGIPFFLPYMHERYFFLGGILLLLCAFAKPKLAPAAICAEVASLGGYHAYLITRYAAVLTVFGVTWTMLIEGSLMAAALVAAVSVLTADLIRQR